MADNKEFQLIEPTYLQAPWEDYVSGAEQMGGENPLMNAMAQGALEQAHAPPGIHPAMRQAMLARYNENGPPENPTMFAFDKTLADSGRTMLSAVPLGSLALSLGDNLKALGDTRKAAGLMGPGARKVSGQDSFEPKGGGGGGNGDGGLNIPKLSLGRVGARQVSSAGVEGAIQNQADALDMGVEAEAAHGAAEAEAAGSKLATSEMYQSAQQRLNASRQRTIVEHQQKRDSLRQEMSLVQEYRGWNGSTKDLKALQAKAEAGDSAAKAKLDRFREYDPNRIYGGSTGRKVAAAIAVAMGAFGSSLTGGPNTALQIINQAIDRDMEEQHRKWLGRKSGKQSELDASQEAFASSMDLFADEKTAQSEWKATKLEQIGLSLDHWRGMAKGNDAFAAAEQLKAGLLTEAQKLRLDIDQFNVGQVNNAQLTNVKLRGEEIKFNAEQQAKAAEGAQLSKKNKETIQSANNLKDLVGRFRSSRSDWTTYDPTETTPASMAAGTQLAALQGEIRKMLNTGAHLSPKEVQMLEAMSASRPGEIGFVGNRLDELEEITNNYIRRAMEADGLATPGGADLEGLEAKPQ